MFTAADAQRLAYARHLAHARHDADCTCAGSGVCEDWNTAPSGARAE